MFNVLYVQGFRVIVSFSRIVSIVQRLIVPNITVFSIFISWTNKRHHFFL